MSDTALDDEWPDTVTTASDADPALPPLLARSRASYRAYYAGRRNTPSRSTRAPIPAFPLEPWPTAAKNHVSAAHLLLRCPSPEQIEAMVMGAGDVAEVRQEEERVQGQDVVNAVAAEEENAQADADCVPVAAAQRDEVKRDEVKRDEPMPAVAVSGRFQLGSKNRPMAISEDEEEEEEQEKAEGKTHAPTADCTGDSTTRPRSLRHVRSPMTLSLPPRLPPPCDSDLDDDDINDVDDDDPQSAQARASFAQLAENTHKNSSACLFVPRTLSTINATWPGVLDAAPSLMHAVGKGVSWRARIASHRTISRVVSVTDTGELYDDEEDEDDEDVAYSEEEDEEEREENAANGDAGLDVVSIPVPDGDATATGPTVLLERDAHHLRRSFESGDLAAWATEDNVPPTADAPTAATEPSVNDASPTVDAPTAASSSLTVEPTPSSITTETALTSDTALTPNTPATIYTNPILATTSTDDEPACHVTTFDALLAVAPVHAVTVRTHSWSSLRTPITTMVRPVVKDEPVRRDSLFGMLWSTTTATLKRALSLGRSSAASSTSFGRRNGAAPAAMV
ncbi:hypothetical protein AMAG_12620 [Allomyces macrogynus ATCC 38327]|uniref:Uncharacterized protein n=1 Tax=Allomyces macrogynus (strain ATCC 38327) TaxID=578462 RepID=A0A0L0SZC5_ALLM3|nr:hypothetical protein AMAG_12620 [Allomyces macrogynus ATCC 38327]|eukprot:KNE67903.1 hypothetical protein AMAG_12620 [Allomyces macrogynus ATCC 38327]